MADSTIALCACGCGRPTSIQTRNDPKRGYVKGEPARYVTGHSTRTSRVTGYKQCTPTTSAVWHRVRAEQALGKSLPPSAIVHHPDRDVWNPKARLVICEDQAYHLLLHARMRIKAAGGNPNTDRVCARCHHAKPLTEFSPTNCPTSRSQYVPHCKPCNRALMKEKYRRSKLSRLNELTIPHDRLTLKR